MRPCPSVPFPQRQQIPRFSAVAAWLSSQHPFHRSSARPCPSVPFPQRQQIPRFGAVAAWLSSRHPFHRPSVRPCPSVPFPQRQKIPRFSAVAESHSAWPLPQALSSYTLSFFHLPKVCSIPAFSSHLPKVCGVATSSRAPCISVFPAAARFPPSEGVQYSRIFVSPSEGAWSRHCFESALCPCFSSRLAFPTFRRCADFPCFRLTFRRCVESPHLRERPVSVFLLRPCISHLPKVCKIPPFSSHLPKVRGVATSSRAPCIRVSPVTVHFSPSEGAQISLVFVSPSEGARSRHSFESALCPCFSSRLAFPTFRRCAVSGAADATILKRPDVLCRKTSIAITRILVFLPLFNRK